MTPSRCRSCEASILWVVSVNGKNMPLDAEPIAGGEFALVPAPEGKNPIANYVWPEAREGRLLYRAHHVTCPDAKKWHKPPIRKEAR